MALKIGPSVPGIGVYAPVKDQQPKPLSNAQTTGTGFKFFNPPTGTAVVLDTPPPKTQYYVPVVEAVAQPIAEPKAWAQPVLGVSEFQAQVDELIDIERRLIDLQVADLLKRKGELKTSVLAAIEDQPPTETVTLKGHCGSVELSACSKEFILQNPSMLFESLGQEVALGIAKFGVTDLKKVLSENELMAFGEYKTTKSRTLKVKVLPA